MTIDHRRPLLAFALVTLLCAFVIGTAGSGFVSGPSDLALNQGPFSGLANQLAGTGDTAPGTIEAIHLGPALAAPPTEPSPAPAIEQVRDAAVTAVAPLAVSPAGDRAGSRPAVDRADTTDGHRFHRSRSPSGDHHADGGTADGRPGPVSSHPGAKAGDRTNGPGTVTGAGNARQASREPAGHGPKASAGAKPDKAPKVSHGRSGHAPKAHAPKPGKGPQASPGKSGQSAKGHGKAKGHVKAKGHGKGKAKGHRKAHPGKGKARGHR